MINFIDMICCCCAELQVPHCPQVRHLEGLVSSSEKAFARLEQDLVTVTKVGGWVGVEREGCDLSGA